MTVRKDDIRKAAGTDMSSDPGDPHGWSFDCEIIYIAKTPPCAPMGKAVATPARIKAWWVCRRCGTTVRVRADVTRRPHSGNEAYDEMAALSELGAAANAERGQVHPRCSEVRTMKEVMES